MREWIDLISTTDSPEVLEEAKFGMKHIAAAAALAGTAGYHVGLKNQPDPVHLPLIIQTYDDDASDIRDVYRADDEAKHEKAVMSPKEKATRLLALTMWGEARSGGPQAMRAVGHVIINRLNSERDFGNSIKGVVWKRKHFSCWNAGDPNREAMKLIAKLPDTNLSKHRWYQALQIAQDIMSGKDNIDPTNGALFYHTKAMGKPYWVSKDMSPIAIIGQHYFYRTDAKKTETKPDSQDKA